MQGFASAPATWIGQQQLWFGQREAALLTDPGDLLEKLALAVNIRQLDPLPSAGGFLQRSAIRIAGDIGLAAIASTPTQSVLDNHHECAIALLQQGWIDYCIAGRTWSARASQSAVFLPGEAMRVLAGHHVGLAYNLSPQLLARYLCELPHRPSIERALAWVQRPHRIDLLDPAKQSSLQTLDLVLRLLDGQAGEMAPSPILLNLEEMLYRLSAALIAPR